MKTHPSFFTPFVPALVVVASVFAAMPASGAESSSPSRAEINDQVIAAALRGELRPVGETAEYTGEDIDIARRSQGVATASPSREAVRAEVREAMARGELIAAGEGSPPNESPGRTRTARAAAKADTVQARAR